MWGVLSTIFKIRLKQYHNYSVIVRNQTNIRFYLFVLISQKEAYVEEEKIQAIIEELQSKLIECESIEHTKVKMTFHMFYITRAGQRQRFVLDDGYIFSNSTKYIIEMMNRSTRGQTVIDAINTTPYDYTLLESGRFERWQPSQGDNNGN